MKFSKLQSRHELLLDLQNQNKPISEEVKSYIDDARNYAKNYSPEERDHLRANLRYWAAYIFEETKDYPDTELAPISQPNTISLLIENGGKILYAVAIVVVLFLGLAQIPKIIGVVQSPSASPAPPQIIIYDKGGTFFVVAFSIFAIIIIFLQVVIFRRQTQLFVSRVGERVASVVETIRKTIVGGAKRGKPLASLRVIEGPPAMIGQELKIFTESVKLGRDPQKADMTFYTSDTNSSISGLHARIEKVNGAWRIVALSQSGSETFVDDITISFNEPHSLQSGQTVRLGYLARQPLVFTFVAEATSAYAPRMTEVDFRKTQQSKDYVDDVFDELRDRGDRQTNQQKQEIRPQDQGQDDDIFNEFRDR